MTDLTLTEAGVDLNQCLLDRYGERGLLVDLHDWPGFMRIVRKYVANHTEAARADERARIVGWLRSYRDAFMADLIERGDHRSP